MSTEFSLMFGGMEAGFIAEKVYEQYGHLGLIALTIFSFSVSLGCVWFLRHAKKRVKQGERSKLNRVVLMCGLLFFILLEAYIMGVVAQNFFVALLPPSLTLFAIQYGVTITYFVSAIFLTRKEMKRLIMG